MAFPTVDASVGVLAETGASTTHAVPLPTPAGGILADDIVLIAGGIDSQGNPGHTAAWPGSWVELVDDTRIQLQVAAHIGWLRMAGGETGTVTVTTSGGGAAGVEGGGWRALLIRGAHATDPPEVSARADGSSTNPDPPSFDPSWGTEDTLWVAIAVNDGNVAITAGPASYSGFGNTRWANNGGAGVGTAWRQNAVAIEDPGAFTMGSEQWGAYVVAFRPAAAATPADVPLDVAAATSTATLALAALTQVPLAASVAQSAATLAVAAPTQVPLGAAAATSAATLDLTVPTTDQFARPVADIDVAGWVASPLWSKLDEAAPDDADFVTGVAV